MRETVEWRAGTIYAHHTVTDDVSDTVDLHCHPYYEVYLLRHGAVRYLVEGRDLRPAPGDALLIRPNTFHGVRVLGAAPYDRMALHFLPETLSPDLRERLLAPFREESRVPGATALEPFLNALLACSRMPPELASLAARPRLEALLTELCRLCPAARPEAAPARRSAADDVLDYVNDHLREKIALESLCQRFYMDKNHINRVFRRATGTTVYRYVCHKRVVLAQQYLLQGMPAAEAAAAVGFRDYSNFYRAFKGLLGYPPSETPDHPAW